MTTTLPPTVFEYGGHWQTLPETNGRIVVHFHCRHCAWTLTLTGDSVEDVQSCELLRGQLVEHAASVHDARF
jgi:hypothetical protein